MKRFGSGLVVAVLSVVLANTGYAHQYNVLWVDPTRYSM